MFAYTMEESVYAFVKTYYCCEKHSFPNEELLEKKAEKVDLKTVLKRKNDL